MILAPHDNPGMHYKPVERSAEAAESSCRNELRLRRVLINLGRDAYRASVVVCAATEARKPITVISRQSIARLHQSAKD